MNNIINNQIANLLRDSSKGHEGYSDDDDMESNNYLQVVMSVILYNFDDFKIVTSKSVESTHRFILGLMHTSGLQLQVDLDLNRNNKNILTEKFLEDIELIRECASIIEKINKESNAKVLVHSHVSFTSQFIMYNHTFDKCIIELDYSFNLTETHKNVSSVEKAVKYLLPNLDSEFDIIVESVKEIAYDNKTFIEFIFDGDEEDYLLIEKDTIKPAPSHIIEAVKSKIELLNQ